MKSSLSEKIARIKSDSEKCMVEHLGMEFTLVTAEKLVARMPVDSRTKQRFGILHGGASAALAETVASVAAWLNIDSDKYAAVGIELNISHHKSVSSGFVTAEATPARIGRRLHTWNVIIKDDSDTLVATARCTLAIIEKKE